jgi:hypothetical protein
MSVGSSGATASADGTLRIVAHALAKRRCRHANLAATRIAGDVHQATQLRRVSSESRIRRPIELLHLPVRSGDRDVQENIQHQDDQAEHAEREADEAADDADHRGAFAARDLVAHEAADHRGDAADQADGSEKRATAAADETRDDGNNAEDHGRGRHAAGALFSFAAFAHVQVVVVAPAAAAGAFVVFILVSASFAGAIAVIVIIIIIVVACLAFLG